MKTYVVKEFKNNGLMVAEYEYPFVGIACEEIESIVFADGHLFNRFDLYERVDGVDTFRSNLY